MSEIPRSPYDPIGRSAFERDDDIRHRVAVIHCRNCKKVIANAWGARECPKCGTSLKASERIRLWGEDIPATRPLSEQELEDLSQAFAEEPEISSWEASIVKRLLTTLLDEQAQVSKLLGLMFNSSDPGLSKYADPRVKDDFAH